MYAPKAFIETDRNVIFDLIEEYGFATLISWGSQEPTVSHVPLLVDRSVSGQERLLGHVARANNQWSQFDGKQPVLAIFHGPHAYVSPAWYSEQPSVPTWNYAVVHVHGRPRMLDAEATGAILKRLIEKVEGPRKGRWKGELPADFVRDQLRAIVGFEIAIDRLEGKFKLSQNKDSTDRAGVLAGLETEPDRGSKGLADFARRHFSRRNGS